MSEVMALMWANFEHVFQVEYLHEDSDLGGEQNLSFIVLLDLS